MTDVSVPTLDRDQILESFMRAAEQDTQQVLRVSNLLTEVQALKTKLLTTYDELVDIHSEAVSRPHVKAKLAELNLPDPKSLNVEPLREKPKASKRGRPARRPTTKTSGKTATPPNGGAASEKPARDEASAPAAESQPA